MLKPRFSAPPSARLDSDLGTFGLLTEPGVYAYDGWKNVSMGVWVGQATLSAVRGLRCMSIEQTERFPEGRSSVVFVLDQLPAPTPEAQLELQSVLASDGLACTAIVLEGTGFWAAGIRGMATNAQRAANNGIGLRIGTTIDEVVAWLPSIHQQRTGVSLEPDELRKVLVHVRERAAARARGLR